MNCDWSGRRRSPGKGGKGKRAAVRLSVARADCFEQLEQRLLLSVADYGLGGYDALTGVMFQPQPTATEVFFVGPGTSPSEVRLRKTLNVNAADTTNADQLWSGGLLGLDLDGAGLTAGVWDAGRARDTHNELSGRVTFGDSASSFHDHSTHVAGTIGATGVVANARGMANQVAIRSYDWTSDVTEMDNDAALLVVTNHSYSSIVGWEVLNTDDYSFLPDAGWADVWFEDRSDYTEDPDFGRYYFDTSSLDGVLYDNPALLSVWSAGNDRGDYYHNRIGDDTYVTYLSADPGNVPDWSGADWYVVPNSGATSAPAGDGNGGTGYDSLPTDQVAKNNLVVGAVNDITADPYSSGNVSITTFSSWGPTDDGRIKPDVVGNGSSLFSSGAGSDSSYLTYSGTSMSAPNVAGTAVLLIEHYQNLFGASPLSATTKGLLIHTAFDASNAGPDYRYGWGVVDAAAAAGHLTGAASSGASDWVMEDTYSGSEMTWQVGSDGSDPLKVTIVWTDPAGPVQFGGVDDSTPVLVNDLDLWITGPGGTYYPWTLDPANPSDPAVATTGNHVDNVEQVLIDAPDAGVYTVHLGRTGATFTQNFSMLLSGAAESWFLDNSDGSPIYAETGAGWDDGSEAGGFRDDYRWHDSGGTGDNLARWAVDLPAGTFEVLATYVDSPSRAHDAPYAVYDGADLEEVVTVDQALAPGDDQSPDGHWWELLGR